MRLTWCPYVLRKKEEACNPKYSEAQWHKYYVMRMLHCVKLEGTTKIKVYVKILKVWVVDLSSNTPVTQNICFSW